MDEHAAEIRSHYYDVRQHSERLCDGLVTEDLCLQGMPDTSPLKWHLAHTTWFFETFVLKPFDEAYLPFNECFEVLFNSYYNAVGQQFPRPLRHMLSRPTVAEVLAYRHGVDHAMAALLEQCPGDARDEIYRRVILGLNHEQQHQELMLTDLKYCLSLNPLFPVYNPQPLPESHSTPLTFSEFEGGEFLQGISGTEADAARLPGFSYDNEGPRHRTWLSPFALADRPVSNGEFIEFIEAGGYQAPEWWHSDGWAVVQTEQWRMPLYWRQDNGRYFSFTLHGNQEVDAAAPVCHVSLYEAMAFAAWKGMRLCREGEWELVATQRPPTGQCWQQGCQHPVSRDPGKGHGPDQLYGGVWEWTQSAYSAYPGYRPQAGALGEYNGKFMLNQMVLRGGSVATPPGHVRATYRNFFYPKDRWQFSGIRLAKDL
ncbi:ergothioneine biosynthesis protein EgtB [Marinobacter zhejiangensis]|uniref:Ergothioneine biosynthesis protein EgtB n=1 Tax=Marinobacter zhejiangensis TaxID=488535 RepID=A0A1I4Q3Z8_9GAMM|nr:ergothioneine biosynthesis protein EgtB [Marinobacter zhejiangensis]SFM34801.1 ergothioneine biosynthesis protein EgtB [Marinobacter zhejiangensis]